MPQCSGTMRATGVCEQLMPSCLAWAPYHSLTRRHHLAAQESTAGRPDDVSFAWPPEDILRHAVVARHTGSSWLIRDG